MEFIKLYEVNQKIMDAIDMETGELLIPEEEFDALIKAGDDGCEYFTALYKNAKATMDALKTEKKARDEDFDVRIKACERTMERASRILSNHLNGEKWEGKSGKISYRKSTATVETDKEAFLNWEGRFQYMEFEPKIHLADIGKAIDSGEKIVGFAREERQNIQIK